MDNTNTQEESVAVPFERENRYIVLKIKDLERLNPVLLEELTGTLSAIANLTTMPQREYVVIESDWPEYEPVWKMLEDRVNGERAAYSMEYDMTTNHDALREALEPFAAIDLTQSGVPANFAELVLRARIALSQPMPEAAAQGATVADLQRQMREVAEAAYKTPGVAVKMPELVAVEGRKFMRGEPSLFDQLPFGEMQSVTAMLSASPAAPEGAKPDPLDVPGERVYKNADELFAALDISDQPSHPQPQAQGEPWPVWNFGSDRENENGTVIMTVLGAHHAKTTDQFITLRSHREAIAQKDAVLDECKKDAERYQWLASEAFVNLSEWAHTYHLAQKAGGLSFYVDAAITRANQVLEGAKS